MRKKSMLQIRIEPELERQLIETCGSVGISVSEVVRSLIEDYCRSAPVRNSVVIKDCPTYRRYSSLASLRRTKSVEISIGEMYCGPGGLAIAARDSRLSTGKSTFAFKHVWATDYDADTCQTYAANLHRNNEHPLVICDDIRHVKLQELPRVDGFLYGFPCNDFSLVGESKGLDGRFGPLYKYGVDYISVAQPLFFLAENVSGLSSSNSGRAFEVIEESLSNAGDFGYNLTSHLYKFEDYGVPQARHRYIIIGIRRDLGLTFEVPAPMRNRVSSRAAIENPPIPNAAKNHELTKQSATVVERLRYIKPGENAWTADIPESLRLNVKGAQLSQIYKRLDPDKPAYTITGSGGGGTHVYHWSEDRALTNRERARLQTFPDDFEFFGSKESVRKQIGMAVPPVGARIILEAVLKTLAGIDYKSVEPSRGYVVG